VPVVALDAALAMAAAPATAALAWVASVLAWATAFQCSFGFVSCVHFLCRHGSRLCFGAQRIHGCGDWPGPTDTAFIWVIRTPPNGLPIRLFSSSC
jgi:hypothetical protein